MRPVFDAASIRQAEAGPLAAGVDLMGQAAHAVARLAQQLTSGAVMVLVGPGNNGGDGLYAAAELAPYQDVRFSLIQDTGLAAGIAAAEAAGAIHIASEDLKPGMTGVQLVIDAGYGLGGRAGLDDTLAAVVALIERRRIPVLAVDIPSGLAADGMTNEASVVANHTITFGGLKPCHVLGFGPRRCGEVHVETLDLALPASSLAAATFDDCRNLWPVPDVANDKYSRGVVGLLTGSETYPGAGILSVAGALHTGTGMVRYLGATPSELVLGRFPSVVRASGRVQAMVVGSGWGGDTSETDRWWHQALAADVPLVIDADALSRLPAALPSGCVLTPHAGELARLLSVARTEVAADPVGYARLAAERFGACVLLKGGTQVVANPKGEAIIVPQGPAWTAQAGSGDVLAGSCGALLAAGLPAEHAALLAASLQAAAASRFPGPYPPDVLASYFPKVIAWLTG